MCKTVTVILLFASVSSAPITEEADIPSVLDKWSIPKAMSVPVEGKLELTS